MLLLRRLMFVAGFADTAAFAFSLRHAAIRLDAIRYAVTLLPPLMLRRCLRDAYFMPCAMLLLRCQCVAYFAAIMLFLRVTPATLLIFRYAALFRHATRMPAPYVAVYCCHITLLPRDAAITPCHHVSTPSSSLIWADEMPLCCLFAIDTRFRAALCHDAAAPYASAMLMPPYACHAARYFAMLPLFAVYAPPWPAACASG